MRIIRIGFVAALLALAAGVLWWMNQAGETPTVELPRFTAFQLTRISPQQGRVYSDREMSRAVDVSRLDWPEKFELYADPQTACEFFCLGGLFVAHPGSQFQYNAARGELTLRQGEFTWNLETPDSPPEIRVGAAAVSLLLPRRGRLNVSNEMIVLWTYSGKGSLRADDQTLSIPEKVRFTRLRTNRFYMENLLPAPESPKPVQVSIPLREPNDSVVRFSWQRVEGADGYVFRLYPSMLRERILMERFIPGNQLNVELMVFQEYVDFYWDVSALEARSKLKGVPSVAGHVRLEGSLLGRKSVNRPPQLAVTSLTVGGNIVLIKGEAESNSQLFINSEPVKIDMDGKFIHTMTFRTIGVKTIEFRLVSPSETETVLTRQVTIFEEGI